jgi:putative Ca2+/H+ antiporter (TMEM165/GDT1 family)
MAAFLFAFLAALVAGLGARDQLLVAWMAARRGPGFGVLVTAIAAALLSAALAGWAGTLAAPQLEPRARLVLVAMALGLAAFELLLLQPGRRPAEPTASLGALGVVLLAQQVTDAARLLVFALAASSAVPLFAVLGGMLGCAVTAVLGWTGGTRIAELPLVAVRRGLGLVLAVVAVYLIV